FLDLVDLPIHETGHLVFRLFGEFLGVAGGSLFQVIVPAVFVGYFGMRMQYYSAAVVLFWVGQSILNVWVYASDAVVMQLVLTSGFTGSEGSFHDWNYLLTRTGLIGSTKLIAGIIRALGTMVIISAGVLSIYYSLFPAEAAEEI
ncbi:MAG: zinc ribbon domain-containing protein, partial [Acidobacteriota bacterium]